MKMVRSLLTRFLRERLRDLAGLIFILAQDISLSIDFSNKDHLKGRPKEDGGY